jgi:hypothetical protein
MADLQISGGCGCDNDVNVAGVVDAFLPILLFLFSQELYK